MINKKPFNPSTRLKLYVIILTVLLKNLKNKMQEYTFALKIGEDYLISPMEINPNKTLFSYCDIESAQELSLLKKTNFIEAIKKIMKNFLLMNQNH